MKCGYITLAAVLLSVAIAQPHRHNHKHQVHHEKRDLVWVTVEEIVTKTVDITTTIWVEADATPSPKQIKSSPATNVLPSRLTTQSPAEFHEAATSSPKPQGISTSEAPYVPPPPPASTPSSSSVYVPPPPPPPPPSTPVYVPPPTTEAPPVAPPQSSAPAVAVAPPTSSPSSGGGGSGSCAEGGPCSGDLTFYDAGLGACGWTTDGESENVIALPVGMMGDKSNGNPFCGKHVTITKNGKSVVAKVVDKCMGCVGESIDLSKKCFRDLGIEQTEGRTLGTWHFN